MVTGGAGASGGGKGRNRKPAGSKLTWTKVVERNPPAESPAEKDVTEKASVAPAKPDTTATSAGDGTAMTMASRFSATASEFVPGGGQSTSSGFSSGAAEFVPGPSISSGAPEFVPGKSNWTNARGTRVEAPAFVPGKATVDYTPAGQASASGSWQSAYNMRVSGADFTPGYGNTVYVAQPMGMMSSSQSAAYYLAAQTVAVPQPTCWFNDDAFSSDSDSSPEFPPESEAAAPKLAVPKPAVVVKGDGEGCESSDKKDTATAASASTTHVNGVRDGGGGPVQLKLETATAAATAGPVQLELAPVTAPPPPGYAARTPPRTFSARVPVTPSSLAAGDESDRCSMIGGASSESDGEWSLPEAAIPSTSVQDLAHGSAAGDSFSEEMSEKLLQKWLQRFANENDQKALFGQWHAWLKTSARKETQEEVLTWLLKRGFDDCRSAETVIAVIKELLHSKEIPTEFAEKAFAEYSEEDLEDLALDNPKVGDFVEALRTVLSTAPVTNGILEVAAAKASASTAPRGDSVTADMYTYTRKRLIELFGALQRQGAAEKASAGESRSTSPRWSTQAAKEFFGDMPEWQEKMTKRENNTKDARGDSGEWRKADARGRGGDAKGKKSGAGPKEALQVSQSSWVAQVKRWKEEKKRPDDEDGVVDEHFVREMRLTLNKLTIEKFDQLSEQIIYLISQSTRPNRGIPLLMQLVFEKATTQHHFINMYVNLCVKLHKWLTDNKDLVQTESQSNFKRILLNQCQSSFEQYLEPPEGFDGLKGTELYEAQVKYKTKMLGNIRLVGELIRRGMLAPKIALAVASELALDDPIVREERLETLAVFLETVGLSLDDPSWSHFAEFDAVFAKVERIVKDENLPCRIRFLLRDVLDLRRGHWRTRKPRDIESEANTPMTIAEVHQKAKDGSKTGTRGNKNSAASPTDKWRERGSTNDDLTGRSSASGSARYVGTSPAASSHASPAVRPQTKVLARPPASPKVAATQSSTSNSAVSRSVPASPVAGSAPASAASPGGGEAAGSRSREELLISFHKEITQTIRQLGKGLDVAAAVQRLRSCPLPPGCAVEEASDLMARIADEPKARRQQLLPLLPALFAKGVLAPPNALRQAVEAFVRDAFADPGSVDPPDLGEIVLREMLPALGLSPGTLSLPACLSELGVDMDDRG